MRLVTVRRSFTEGECFPLFLWSDWHRFNANCAKSVLARDRDEILTTPNAMYTTLGDLTECIAPDDPRYDPAHVDWSLIEARDMGRLSDVAVEDRVAFESPVIDRCLATTDGNHDAKWNARHHTDINLRALERMGRPDLWSRGAVLLRIVFSDHHRHTCK